MIGIWLT